jgi:hypothetical protein
MPCPPLLLFALRGSLQGTQTLGPEDLEGGPELSDGLGTRTIEALRPVTTLRDEARLFEDPEVLGDRRTGDVEAARDVADRELLARDETKDLAAARLAKCGKRVDFASVSVSLPTVKAMLAAAVTYSRLNHDQTGCSRGKRVARAFATKTHPEVTERWPPSPRIPPTFRPVIGQRDRFPSRLARTAYQRALRRSTTASASSSKTGCASSRWGTRSTANRELDPLRD